MQGKYFKLSLLVICFFVSVGVAFSQTGSLSGLVLDGQNGESIIGASIFLQDQQSTGTITNIDGEFELKGIPVGTHNVVVSYLSYETVVIENIEVEEGKTTELNAVLYPGSINLQEATVVDFRKTNTEAAMLLEMRKSSQVLSGITSQQIGRTQDRDAGQVVKRIPGVLLSGNFINIRGLNERYNTVMLHEGFAPSMEADVKSFAFDIIPSSQIDRILVYKSPSASTPAEFAGGLVKIYTRNFPDENFTTVSVSTGFRENTTFKDFRHQDNGSMHFTSFSYSHHRLPDDFPADIRQISNPDRIEEVGRSLPNSWEAETQKALPNMGLSLAKGLRFDLGSWQLGNVTSVNYSNSRAYHFVERRDFDTYDFNNNKSTPIYHFEDDQYNQAVRLGVLHNWSLRRPGTQIEFNNLFNHHASTQYVNRLGNHFDFGFLPDNHSFDHVYRGIYNAQLTGKHQLDGVASTFDWMVGYAHTFRNQPDYKRYRSDRDNETGERTLYVPFGQAQAFFLGRFFSEMTENNVAAATNYTRRLGTATGEGEILTLSGGAFFEYKKRNFGARNIGYVRGNTLTFPMENLDLTISELFDIIDNVNGIRIDEQSNPNDSYEADNTLLAGYINAEIPLLTRFKVIAGLRYEHNIQTMLSSEQNGALVDEKHTTPRLLPSVNMSYDLNSNSLLRAAWGMTLNRPQFRELAPFSFYDFNYNFTYKGNPGLGTPTIHNADLRYELYPHAGEVFSLAAFYKHFIDPIEVVYVPGAGSGGAKNFTFENAASAFSAGVELEIRKNMRNVFGSPFMEKISLMLNAALIYSEVDLGDRVVAQQDNRPLIGQSPYLINAGIFYHNRDSDIQFNVMYHVVGPRIILAGFDDYPDIYEMPRHLVDLNFSCAITPKIQFNMGVVDLFSQKYQLMQDANQDNSFDENTDQVIQSYYPGRLITTGFTFNL